MKTPHAINANVVEDESRVGDEQHFESSSPNEFLLRDQVQDSVEPDDWLTFEPEIDPEDFFANSSGELVSGSLVSLVTSSLSPSAEEDMDWEVNLSPVLIIGDGIRSEGPVIREPCNDHEFLKVRNRGPRSIKRAVVPSGTRLFVDPEVCLNWAEDILEKGWINSEDIDTLVSFCGGNGEFDELRRNILRTLEAAGLQLFDETSECEKNLWDYRLDVSVDDLTEALEATLTRDTRLPGMRRFCLDKTDEARLFGQVVRAKQELHLGILACEEAIQEILRKITQLFDGTLAPGFVTIRTIFPSRPEQAETPEFVEAAETLRRWSTSGRVMEGKRRRNALTALESLELSLSFHKEIVTSLAEHEGTRGASCRLDRLIDDFEGTIEHMLLEHLPYARRFAARNAVEGEDLEDLFQVAFSGLQRATRRFDPNRGHRFSTYSTFWMTQVVTRWRANDCAIVRIPVHRHERIADLDRATNCLEARQGRFPTVAELVSELGWEEGDVRSLLRIPRQCSDLDDLDFLRDMVLMPDQLETAFLAETYEIASGALKKLPERRQADVIRARFGIGCDDLMTLEEIGQVYGVTRERIRQIEASGLTRLSKPGLMRRLRASPGS